MYFKPHVAFLATDGISWYMLKISPSSMASDSMQYWYAWVWIASSKAWRRMYWRHSGLVIRRYTASTRLLATRESAVEKKPRLRMTMRRSSSVRPSGFFQRAMSAVMLTSCGIQWFAQPSRYFCHAQSYLNGTSWLRSARQLIIIFSSTATRALAPSSSARPSAMSRLSSAALARLMASESLAVTARAS
ncbi:hypothetical protein AP060_02317 [Pseudomonas sp. TAD18]|nr:hypothetical protein AP060_02317 [Pseudomonas sp. TAD18]KVV06708.1 hypothetical protein AP059_02259 [Pseudomonas sp. TAA207]